MLIFCCSAIAVLYLKSLDVLLLITAFKVTVGICGCVAGPQKPGVKGSSSSHCYNPLQGVVLASPEPVRFYHSAQRAAAGPKPYLIRVRVSGTREACFSQVNGEDNLDLAKPACKTNTKGLACSK